MPARTNRNPTAEFVDDVAVFAHDLVGARRDLMRPIAVYGAYAQLIRAVAARYFVCALEAERQLGTAEPNFLLAQK